ncbi:MAG: extracellular solute-binding protein [Treponema sp.]|jgi:raffinose/stachyose/melibiose transport system substrate-binding protein|nr:extracellular solute-binding protein [Treponema sp.]
MKKRSMPVSLVALFCVFTFFVLGGCQKQTAPAASDSGGTARNVITTIEFFQQKMEEGPQRGYQQVAERYNAEFADRYKIEINTVPDAGTVLTTRVVSGDIPPLFSDYPTQLQFKEKVKNGIPLDISNESFMSRVNPPAVLMSKAPDNKDYAIPLSHNFMAVYYNIDIFNANGLTIPVTYDEFIAVCKKLQAANIQPLVFTFATPGRVGHMFQAMNAAWTADGVERLAAVMNGSGDLRGDEVMSRMASRVLEVTSYGNEDAFALPDTGMWENFANGKAAMCITGSYARGTIQLANANLNMGVFPLPNDTPETTTLLSGIDAALCVSARTGDEQKAAGLAFLEFISRTENAQIFCDNDGAPSTITAVSYQDARVNPVIDKMKTGPLHDWFASTIPGNVQNEIYNVVQEFLMNKKVDPFLTQLQQTIVTASAN